MDTDEINKRYDDIQEHNIKLIEELKLKEFDNRLSAFLGTRKDITGRELKFLIDYFDSKKFFLCDAITDAKYHPEFVKLATFSDMLNKSCMDIVMRDSEKPTTEQKGKEDESKGTN